MSHVKRSVRAGVLVLAVMTFYGCSGNAWQSRLDSVLPQYGHRNWIVIADSAYPKQSAQGIETIATGKGQLEVLDVVLDAIADAPHVQAIIMLDAELEHVAETDPRGSQRQQATGAEVTGEGRGGCREPRGLEEHRGQVDVADH